MRLSVVVTIVDAGRALERCLAALAAQQNPPELEVLIPWDDSVPSIAPLAARYPAFAFPAMGPVTTQHPIRSAAGQHELFDRRRATGLAAATGDVVAILEDRGVPRAEWARALAAAHERLAHGVIGGAIENGQDAPLNWAVYFCDFGRYQRPFEAGPRDWVSDVNIGYKRRALDQTREAWRDRYHETTVNWALQRAGETLYLIPDAVVDQRRDDLRLGALLGERFASGRLFAYTRVQDGSLGSRALYLLLTPVLPFVLLLRHGWMQAAKRVRFGQFLRASPVVFVLLVAWCLGEGVGYLTGKP